MTRHSDRAGPALRALNDADPALAALALWCDHRDRAEGPAAETVGSTIHYGPAFAALPRHEQVGLAAHHILHVALRHTGRMAAMAARMGPAFAPGVYAIAADAIVNEALVQAGHALPRPALLLTGLLAAALGDRSAPAAALAVWDVDRLYIRLMQDGGDQGTARRATDHAQSRAFAPDLQPDAATAPERGTDDAQWRQHLARALESGRRAGRGIGVAGHRLADMAAPATPWEVILRGLVTRAVTPGAHPSHRRPARSWIAMEAQAQASGGPAPAFQPGLIRQSAVPRIVVGLDASGSVDAARLGRFMAEVAGIARRCRAELHLIAFDAVPQPALQLDPARWQAQLAAVPLPRGGGTSFVPVLAAAMALRPSVIVMLTDLEGDFGPGPRGVPVIWAVPDAPALPVVPFGRILTLAR